MKKLVTAFALCAAISAMAVESENIVGYVNVSIPQGLRFTVPAFNTVGGDGTSSTLGDITPVGWEGANSDTAQLIDASGEPIQTIWYWPSDGGWFDFDDDSVDINGQVIKTGTGMIVDATQAGASFTMSGQVALSPYDLELVDAGLYFIGNPVPRILTLGEIVPSNWEGANSDTAQLIDASGEPIQTIWYWPADGGWFDFDDDSVDINSQEIPVGGGIIVDATQANATFSFPAAI